MMRVTDNHHMAMQKHTGFTLLEVLVTVGILAVLMAIALAGISRARDFARRSANEMLIDAIATGLDHYRKDFNVLPPSYGDVTIEGSNTEPWFGCQILAQALLGGATIDEGDPTHVPADPAQPTSVEIAASNVTPIEGDRVEGLGWRAKPRGKIYGPYVSPKISTALFGVADDVDKFRAAFVDHDGQPVLYYLINPEHLANPGSEVRYIASHNSDGNRYHTDPEHYVGGPGTSEDAAGAASGDDVDKYVMRSNDTDIEYRTDLPEYLICTQGGDAKWWDQGDPNPSSDDITNLEIME